MNNIKIINGKEVNNILKNKEDKIVNLVKTAYLLHGNKQSEVPHSIFLKFEKQPKDRIIGLPSYLGGNKNIAGFKWISSFPDNIKNGIDRASAVLILNSMKNGRPIAMLESSIISAKRTAASAALAAKYLSTKNNNKILSIVGCGFIGYETLRFTLSQIQTITKIFIFDLNIDRAKEFKDKAKKEFGKEIIIIDSIKQIFEIGNIIALTTTTSKPYINNDIKINNDCLILNISLRDISAEIIAKSINIVDDFDHVNRADTSIHLATKLFRKEPYYETISNVINQKINIPNNTSNLIIFSPFGLGILDIILADFCLYEADKKNFGTTIESFFPIAWNVKS
jgi:ornithine cyclodeaminase